MGGMLAMRYALLYPQDLSGLVLVNPIGLEDWKAKGLPMATVDQLYERELKTIFNSIKRYQQTTYYADTASVFSALGPRHWMPRCLTST
jgi:pimeloyl-ACP methyl ester carboxylesterase